MTDSGKGPIRKISHQAMAAVAAIVPKTIPVPREDEDESTEADFDDTTGEHRALSEVLAQFTETADAREDLSDKVKVLRSRRRKETK